MLQQVNPLMKREYHMVFTRMKRMSGTSSNRGWFWSNLQKRSSLCKSPCLFLQLASSLLVVTGLASLNYDWSSVGWRWTSRVATFSLVPGSQEDHHLQWLLPDLWADSAMAEQQNPDLFCPFASSHSALKPKKHKIKPLQQANLAHLHQVPPEKYHLGWPSQQGETNL